MAGTVMRSHHERVYQDPDPNDEAALDDRCWREQLQAGHRSVNIRHFAVITPLVQRTVRITLERTLAMPTRPATT